MRLSKRHMDAMYDIREIYVDEERYEHAFAVDTLIDISDSVSKGRYDDEYLNDFRSNLARTVAPGPSVDAEVTLDVAILLGLELSA